MRTPALILISIVCPAMAVAAESLETLVLLNASSLMAGTALLRSRADVPQVEEKESRASETVSPVSTAEPELFENGLLVCVLSVLSQLLAVALLLAIAGSTSLTSIEQTLCESYQPQRQELVVGEGSLLGIAAVVFWLVGSAASFGMFPLQGVLQTGFSGAPPLRVFIAAVSQRVFSAVMIWKVVVIAMPGFESTVRISCLVPGIASSLAGAFLACRSESLRRMSGSFWMSWGGIVLISAAAAAGQGDNRNHADAQWRIASGAEVAMLALVISSIALFLLMACERWLTTDERRVDFDEDLTGLGTQHQIVAAAVCAAFLTLCAIPPLPGFWCVVLLIANAFQPFLESGQSPSLIPSASGLLAVAAVIISLVVLAGRLARPLSLMFHHRPVRRIAVTGGRTAAPIALAVSVLLLWLGVFPGRLLIFIQSLPF